MEHMAFPAGTLVGASFRRSQHFMHSTVPPYRGEVLALDDPRAWRDTLAFPGREPSAEEAKAHVAKCLADGLHFNDRVPVRWTFEEHKDVRTYWERVESLSPYEDECAAVEAIRRENRPLKTIRLRSREGYSFEERTIVVEEESEIEWKTPLIPWLGANTHLTFSKSMWEEIKNDNQG